MATYRVTLTYTVKVPDTLDACRAAVQHLDEEGNLSGSVEPGASLGDCQRLVVRSLLDLVHAGELVDGVELVHYRSQRVS